MKSWWRHDMGLKLFHISGPLWVTGGSPHKSPAMRSSDNIFAVAQNISCWIKICAAYDLRRHDAHVTVISIATPAEYQWALYLLQPIACMHLINTVRQALVISSDIGVSQGLSISCHANIFGDIRLYLWSKFYFFVVHVAMMTSSNGDISALPALCVGNSPSTGEFPSQRPVTRSFEVFFGLNKRLSKQSWGWWFETPSCSLWRHCKVCGVSFHAGSRYSQTQNSIVQTELTIERWFAP